LLPPGPVELKATHKSHQPLKVFYCHFNFGANVDLDALSNRGLDPRQLGSSSLATINGFATAENSRNRDAIQESIIWRLLLELEQQATKPGGAAATRIGELVNRIRENPSDRYSVGEMAAESGHCEGHFRRLFQRTTNMTPMQFVLSQRMRLAKYYLSETKLTVEEIAFLCGYQDIFFFSRQFKERCKVSPSQFRKHPTPSTQTGEVN